MTGEPQWLAVSGRSDNPEDFVRVGLRIPCHQRVTEYEPRHLSALSERISDRWRIRGGRPARSGSPEQRRRAATATGIRRAPYGRRAGSHAGLRTGARCWRRGAGPYLGRMTCRAGRGEEGARDGDQNGSPGHVMTITLRLGARISPLDTCRGCAVARCKVNRPGCQRPRGDRSDASRCGRQHGRSTVSSPTLVREAVSAT
jgi:hypothetical protein